MKMKTILVTGGTGFLGSNLCDYLIKKGHKVICADNNITGSTDNVKHLLDNPNFELVEHDVTKPFFSNCHIDQIYNLACPASPKHYQFNAIKTIKTNVLGTINMLGLAKRHNARILQASTSEVYGDPLEHPQKETYWGNVNPIGIRACYDEGKRAAECLFFDYHRQHDVDIKVVRIFNTYGSNMAVNDGRVISNFIVQALRNEDITLYGDGTQTRSFCYVSDLIEGMYTMMKTENLTGPVNLGNPEEHSIAEIAKIIIELSGSKSKIVYKPLPQNDPLKRQADISLAKEKLNWDPKLSFNEGIKKTIDYFKKKLESMENEK